MVTVVYDTNVVVSAALKSGSLPAVLVALAMARRVRLVLSRAILKARRSSTLPIVPTC